MGCTLAVHDRDTKFTEAFDARVKLTGAEIIKTPFEAPIANAFAESWIGQRHHAKQAQQEADSALAATRAVISKAQGAVRKASRAAVTLLPEERRPAGWQLQRPETPPAAKVLKAISDELAVARAAAERPAPPLQGISKRRQLQERIDRLASLKNEIEANQAAAKKAEAGLPALEKQAAAARDRLAATERDMIDW